MSHQVVNGMALPSRELTYPTWGSSENHGLKSVGWEGICDRSLEGTTVDLSTCPKEASLLFHVCFSIFGMISHTRSSRKYLDENQPSLMFEKTNMIKYVYKNTQPLANLLTFVAYIFSRLFFFTIFYFMVPTG